MTTEQIPFNDLSWQWQNIKDKFLPEFVNLVDGGHFCLGPAVEKFEASFAEYTQAHHVIGVNSGTSALHLSLIAAGIKAGDKVLIPAMTFIATASAVLYIGAIPVLCDVEPETGNINVESLGESIDPAIKAIIPVHLYGQPANMDKIVEFAKRHQLVVIEDACQAHGAIYKGKPVGTIGAFGCFSFYPGKNLGAMGEAGAITTEDEVLAKRLRALRHHAQYERYIHQEVGFNYRMEGVQGLALFHKMAHIREWTESRKKIAKRYLNGLADLPLGLPQLVHHDHVYHLFVVRTPKRDQLANYLDSKGISTGFHYPVPLQRQPNLQVFMTEKESFPVADHYATQGISLPLFPSMTDEQVDRVIKEIHEFFETTI